MQARNMLLISLFAGLMVVSSFIIIPIGVMPFTMQLVVVLLTGLCLGAVYGAASILLWILLGVIGLPVFAQGMAGLMVLAKPTGGFIIGFVICAWLVGFLAERQAIAFARTIFIMLAGLTVIYIMGYIGIMVSFKYVLNKPLTWEQALSLAVFPFILPDLLKTVFAAYLGIKIKKALRYAGLS